MKALCTNLLQTVKFHLTQSYISDKCITFSFSQRKSINGANYICTNCTQVACWLRKDPVCSRHITLSCKRASSEEKYHLLAFTFKTVIHSRSDEKIIILQVGCNTGKKSIYIAQFQHIYNFFFNKLYIIQHLDGCASTQLNLWMYFLTICGDSISTPQYVLHQHYH